MYHDGTGIPQNYTQAIAYFQKATENKEIDSQYSLGTMYMNGEGLPKTT